MDFETGSKIKACIPDSTSFPGLRDEALSGILEFVYGTMPADVFISGMTKMHPIYTKFAECIVSAFQPIL